MLLYQLLSFYVGNIKWGFTNTTKPLPVEQIQSKWDKEYQSKRLNQETQEAVKDIDCIPIHEAVSWGKVLRIK